MQRSCSAPARAPGSLRPARVPAAAAADEVFDAGQGVVRQGAHAHAPAVSAADSACDLLLHRVLRMEKRVSGATTTGK